jgi:hypothetical protein
MRPARELNMTHGKRVLIALEIGIVKVMRKQSVDDLETLPESSPTVH